jgi:hypothetical protein
LKSRDRRRRIRHTPLPRLAPVRVCVFHSSVQVWRMNLETLGRAHAKLVAVLRGWASCKRISPISHAPRVTPTMSKTFEGEVKAPSISAKLPELSEDEQWRLINDTGILNRHPVASRDDEEDTPLAEEIFNSVILIIPFSFLLLMMDMYVSSITQTGEGGMTLASTV